ncbi:MAG: VOC family protein [Saccharopolyspora sp.]|uniref:VOC family protein n=1 Tax=unclassified Saccharopolyspora TaxID=2646250 RepID=UPI0025DC7D63|nr:VOC family protein [Saccharopolyspora sp.]MBQ6643861.1 VOC family protein [Saccharopolyspora sp.]
MNKITACLWFDGQAEEAAEFYTSIFEDARIVEVMRNGESGPGPAGSVLTVEFELFGRRFVGLNGGPLFHFTEAISLMVDCESQEEVDRRTEQLLAGGGEQGPCGWLKDRFGLSWQVAPQELFEMLRDPDQARTDRLKQAMYTMHKLDVKALRKAYEGTA